MKTNIVLLLLGSILWSFNNKPQKTWVAIGDSITYLNDHLDETGHRVQKGYMTRLCEKLPAYTYINQGYNGWTAKKIAENIEKLNIEKADVYTLFLGTNDWWAGIPAGTLADYNNSTGSQTVAGSMRIIIDHLKYRNQEAKIVMISPMQRGDFVYLNNHKNNAWGSYKAKNGQMLVAIVSIIKEIGKANKIPVVDLYHEARLGQKKIVKYKWLKNPSSQQYQAYYYPDFINIPFDTENDEYPYPIDAVDMTYDGLHPSDQGNALIAEKLARVFKKF